MTSQLAIGISAAVIALMAAWAWRSSATPVWIRLVLPACAVAAAALVPILNVAMADAERVTTLDQMPDCFAIVALRAHDEVGTVDLWVNGSGRIVNIPLDADVKDTLRHVQAALAKGEPSVRICKEKSKKSAGKGGSNDDGEGHGGVPSGGSASKMVIDESLFLKNMKENTQ